VPVDVRTSNDINSICLLFNKEEAIIMKDKVKGLQIGLLIREINSKINSNLRNKFENTGLTLPQIMLVRILLKYKKLKVSEISAKMSLAKSTVSGIIDRLEKQDIIKRTRDSKDKRIVYIELASEGYELGMKFRDNIEEYFGSIFDDTNEEEIEIIINGLNTLKNVLDR